MHRANKVTEMAIVTTTIIVHRTTLVLNRQIVVTTITTHNKLIKRSIGAVSNAFKVSIRAVVLHSYSKNPTKTLILQQ